MISAKLTQEDKEEILKRIRAKWTGHRECPICNTNRWEMSPHVVSADIVRSLPGGEHTVGVAYPSVLLACDNCGYTLTFNLVILGLLERYEKEFPPPKETGDV